VAATTTSSPPFTLFDLRLRLGQRRLWFGPAVAGICGALASGKVGLNAASVISLVLLVFLADPLLGAVWTTLAPSDQFATPVAAAAEQPIRHFPTLPYTTSGSPGDRLHRWLDHLANETPMPAILAAIGGKLLFALGVSLVLGPAVAVVTAIALAWALFWTRVVHRPHSAGARAVFALGLPWLLGFVTFANSSLLPAGSRALISSPAGGLSAAWVFPLLPALAYSIVGAGLWRGKSLLGTNLVQGALVVLLFALKTPLLAAIVAYALVFQIALQPHRKRFGHPWYLRHSQWFVLLGMVALAVGVAPGS